MGAYTVKTRLDIGAISSDICPSLSHNGVINSDIRQSEAETIVSASHHGFSVFDPGFYSSDTSARSSRMLQPGSRNRPLNSDTGGTPAHPQVTTSRSEETISGALEIFSDPQETNCERQEMTFAREETISQPRETHAEPEETRARQKEIDGYSRENGADTEEIQFKPFSLNHSAFRTPFPDFQPKHCN